MARLIQVGSFDAATDKTMAFLVELPGTDSRAAIVALIGPAAADVIANDPSVVQAAVDRALADEGLTRNGVTFGAPLIDATDGPSVQIEARLGMNVNGDGSDLYIDDVSVDPGQFASMGYDYALDDYIFTTHYVQGA